MSKDVQIQQVRDERKENVIAAAIQRRDDRIRAQARIDRGRNNIAAAKHRSQFWAIANAC